MRVRVDYSINSSMLQGAFAKRWSNGVTALVWSRYMPSRFGGFQADSMAAVYRADYTPKVAMWAVCQHQTYHYVVPVLSGEPAMGVHVHCGLVGLVRERPQLIGTGSSRFRYEIRNKGRSDPRDCDALAAHRFIEQELRFRPMRMP